MRSLSAEGASRASQCRVDFLQRFETVELIGMEARAGGAVRTRLRRSVAK
jgi:hypothetical protein